MKFSNVISGLLILSGVFIPINMPPSPNVDAAISPIGQLVDHFWVKSLVVSQLAKDTWILAVNS